MKEYILTVIGAAVLSAFAMAMTPESWQKYIQVITGIVVLCCIVAPAAKLIKTDIVFSIPDTVEHTEYDADLNKKLIIDEFTKNIEKDIEERMKKEFNINISAEVEIGLNSENEVEGVKKISISGNRISAAGKARLCQIYGVDNIYEK